MKHLRWLTILLALALALAALSAVLGALGTAKPDDMVELPPIEAQALAGPKVPYYAFLDVEDLEASSWYSLVDLDDRTNFPHYQINSAVLKQLHYTGVLSDATHWDLQFGVVCAISDNGADVEWFHTSHRVRATQFDEKWTLPEHGLNLVVTSEKIQFVATEEYTLTVAVTTTTALESPVTEAGVITTYAEVGDIIMYVEEVDAGGHIDLSVGVAYDTQ